MSLLAGGLSLVFLGGSSGEIFQPKRMDPSAVEECAVCHKGRYPHQIDDSRAPWCVECHRIHQVGDTLGLETYFKRSIRISHEGRGTAKKEEIIEQKMILIPAGEFIMG
ncbi:MAG: hypothetical protein ACE5HN_09060, partial [Nitrospiria bacterium]